MTRARTLADMISDGVIGTTELADDVITPVKLDETGNYTIAQLDVNGTLTSDGLTVDGTPVRFNSTAPMLYFMETGVADSNHRIRQNAGNLYFQKLSDDEATSTNRMLIDGGTGDISFYDTSGNAKFFWDASDASLGVGGSEGQHQFGIHNAGAATAILRDTSDASRGLRLSSGTAGNPALIDTNSASKLLAFGVNGSEAMRINSSGVVTIGDPNASSYGGGLTVATATGSYITVGDTGSGEQLRLEGGSGLGRIGTISNHDLQIITNGTSNEVARFDTNGNFLVGGTNLNPIGNHVSQVIANGTTGLGVHRDGGVPFKAGTDSNRNIIECYRQGSLIGALGVADDDNLVITSTASNHGGLKFNNTAMGAYVNGASSDGTMDIGTSVVRFKDLHLSGTIEIENGTGNVGVGKDALRINTGSNNTAVGHNAGYNTNTGTGNLLLGHNAGLTNATGYQNVYLGQNAGYSSTGFDNTFVGGGAGYSSTGAGNTFLGRAAGQNMVNGSNNTILGRYNGNQDGLDIRTSSNNIVLSDGAGNPQADIDSTGRFYYNRLQGVDSRSNVWTGNFGSLSSGNMVANTWYIMPISEINMYGIASVISIGWSWANLSSGNGYVGFAHGFLPYTAPSSSAGVITSDVKLQNSWHIGAGFDLYVRLREGPSSGEVRLELQTSNVSANWNTSDHTIYVKAFM